MRQWRRHILLVEAHCKIVKWCHPNMSSTRLRAHRGQKLPGNVTKPTQIAI